MNNLQGHIHDIEVNGTLSLIAMIKLSEIMLSE